MIKIQIIPIIFVCSILPNSLSGGDGMQMRKVTSRAREALARCAFTIHEKGPEGAEIKDVTLDQELFYKIRCEPQKGYCLRVSNCTKVNAAEESGGGSPSYPIIDQKGCSMEALLFQHVQYEDDFTAGIFNPYPIRFRSRSTGVQFQCVTSLLLLEKDGQCPRESCDTTENNSPREKTKKYEKEKSEKNSGDKVRKE